MPPVPATDQPARKLTYQDYLAFPEDGQRHEVLGGVEVVTPPPLLRHQVVVARLLFLLARWVEEGGGGLVLTAPVGVRLSEHDIVEPDLVYVSEARREVLHREGLRGAPDLLVEVLSDSTRRRDLREKREAYGRGGVREYWVVDPVARRLEVFRAEGPELVRQLERWEDSPEPLTSPLLPGFEVPVAEVFRGLPADPTA